MVASGSAGLSRPEIPVQDRATTKPLEKAVAAARDLSPDPQDDIARVVLRIAGEARPSADLTDEDEASLATSRAQAARGAFAARDAVRAVWAKHGL